MLYLVGLGLGDMRDITVRGLEIVRSAERVYLEAYTSILMTGGHKELEDFYGREVLLADRDLVEQAADEILNGAEEKDVVFLVVGDPLGATTHTDLMLRAKQKNITCQLIHNTSILTAVGCCGLQLYSFGETVSIVMWTDTWRPDSFYDKILANRRRGLHTLCLLDIKMRERSVENMIRRRDIFEPPRFLTATDAIAQLLEISRNRSTAAAAEKQTDGSEPVDEPNSSARAEDSKPTSTADNPELNEDTICVALARVGAPDQCIASGRMGSVGAAELGPPIHSLVIAGDMHELEVEMLTMFAVHAEEFGAVGKS